MPRVASIKPNWQALYDVAAAQEGLFTTRQAAAAGYSPPLLSHHQKVGRVTRLRRGIYRLAQFPPGEHEDLVAAWLWADAAGTFSHQTALSLHALSDALPAKIHQTLPLHWQRRRLRVPTGLSLHYSDVPSGQRTWVGPVPVTVPLRTLTDCASAGVPPDLVRQAARQALGRGLVTKADLKDLAVTLQPFGGIGR